MNNPQETLQDLILRLASLPHETEWLEFKVNNKNPEKIGETLSALSNSAALHKQDYGYIVWGVADAPHEIVGTEFQPRTMRISGQDLEHFLNIQLRPHTNLSIQEAEIDGKSVVVFQVERAMYAPISYRGQEWIRIGSHNKPLREFFSIEKRLWQAFDKAAFETAGAASGLMDPLEGDTPPPFGH